MQTKRQNIWAGVLAIGGLAAIASQIVSAQEAKLTTKVDARTDLQVLTRGPVHEAYIEQVNLNPTVGLVAPKSVPEPINEIPPAVKPAGENVTWIPGYWSYDGEAQDFLWISGVWRVPPPGMRWVPGYWKTVEDKSQWIAGYWIRADVKQVPYRQYPAKSLERGASSVPPSPNHFYVPGAWEPARPKEKWRPGYWVPQQENWVWVPSRCLWTPGGAVYADGYWDYTLGARGQLFAPVRLNSNAGVAVNTRYSPVAIIPNTKLLAHLWVRPSYNHYYFGDYYGASADLGIRPWYAAHTAKVGIDPLFSYYGWHYGRGGVNYHSRLVGWNDHFVKNVAFRPAHTLDAQLAFVKAHADYAHIAQSVVALPLTDLARTADYSTRFVQLDVAQRIGIATSALGLRTLGNERLRLESSASPGLVLDGTLAQTVDLSTQALELPVVRGLQIPGVGANVGAGVGVNVDGAARTLKLPANPQDLINVKPIVPVDPPVEIPDLPLLPF